MSSTVVGLLVAMAFGVGTCCGFVVSALLSAGRDEASPPSADSKPESTVYFGRDDDHPDDIERQGSHPVPAPSASPYVNGRDYGARYDGMADIEHLHDQQDRA